MANIKCIDVSTWQGTIDWKKVKAAGYGHAILRAGYGREVSQKDAQFEANYKNAKAAGVKLGVYWYSYADDVASAKLEAAACLTVLKGKTFEMPVFFDMEESKQMAFGKATLTSMAKAFCEAVKKGGYAAGVYANPNWFRNYLDYDELRKTYPIWLAQYYTSPSLECDVWQYSSEGTVSGISGNVDMNIIYNEGIIKTNTATPMTNSNLGVAGVQALLRQAYAQGIVKTFVKPIDNKQGKLTNAAILEAKEYLGYKNADTTFDLKFISELESEVSIKRTAKENVAIGDVNADGKIDVKDVTALQKEIADIE